MTRSVAGIVLAAMLSSNAFSQQAVTFPTVPSERLPYAGQVEAILTLPPKGEGKVPAVVLIHAGGGFPGSDHYEYYGVSLREAGIATLGLILFRAGSRPFQSHVPSDFLPHAFGALKYLAAHPNIDAGRIGIMGFSLGGILSMYTASGPLASEHLGSNGQRFAAHVPIYPACWVHEANALGSRKLKMAGAYVSLTGAPVHILAGAKDRHDDPDTCQKFVDALSPADRKSIALTVFPNATHVWDVGRSYRYFDRFACKGKGCDIDVVFDSDAAQRGRQIVVEFFTSNLIRAEKK